MRGALEMQIDELERKLRKLRAQAVDYGRTGDWQMRRRIAMECYQLWEQIQTLRRAYSNVTPHSSAGAKAT
jgi:hypothetical protein